jgi:DNA-binding NtrC family response regulator
METKTILIVDSDYALREQLRNILRRNMPNAKVLEYILVARALFELKSLNIDMLIAGERLLDGDGDTLVRTVRLKMPLLPIITLDHDPNDRPPAQLPRLHQVVATDQVEEQFMPTVFALMHNDSLVHSSPATSINATFARSYPLQKTA